MVDLPMVVPSTPPAKTTLRAYPLNQPYELLAIPSLKEYEPAGDGCEIVAVRYELRYGPAPLDDASFAAATRFAATPRPAPSGTPETVEVTGLEVSRQAPGKSSGSR